MDDPEIELPPILLPGYESRQLARSIIVLTVLVIGLPWLRFLAAPGFIGPMTYEPAIDPSLVPLAPLAMQLVGVGWMVRIYRAACDVEPDQHHWRYRGR